MATVSRSLARPLRMTEEEFADWDWEETRVEWVDGEVVVMPPSSIDHGRLATWLFRVLAEYVEARDLGEVFKTDIAVRLPKRKRRRCPDVFFVPKDRLDIVREKHIEGPPDFILEIVSKDSVDRDWRDKYLDYEAERVPEYWIVDSLSKRVEAYRLGKRGKYRPIALADGKLESTAIPGFWSRPEWLLGPDRPTVREMQRLLGV